MLAQDKETALMYACNSGVFASIKALVDAGAEVNARSVVGVGARGLI